MEEIEKNMFLKSKANKNAFYSMDNCAFIYKFCANKEITIPQNDRMYVIVMCVRYIHF